MSNSCSPQASPLTFYVSTDPAIPQPHASTDHRYNSLLFQFIIQILTHARVIGFSYGSNTRDAVGRVSRSQVDFDMATTAASSWILAATTSHLPSKSEFQHSSPTFRPGILAAAMDTSSWRASPAMGNASVDDTDAVVVATFFFTIDGKTFVPPFNCYIRNTIQCQMAR
jgi:uncharacterized protein YaiE (UPF0345 family)